MVTGTTTERNREQEAKNAAATKGGAAGTRSRHSSHRLEKHGVYSDKLL